MHSEYQALTESVGCLKLSRAIVRLSGDDARSFVHNMTTNHIENVPVGQGCESFALDAQGKIVGYFVLLKTESDLWVITAPDEHEQLVAHWDRHVIREEVEFDVAADGCQILVSGPDAATVVGKVWGARLENTWQSQFLDDERTSLLCRSHCVAPDNYSIFCPPERAESYVAELNAAGATSCGSEWYDVLRIEHRFPEAGKDVTQKNLPQEVSRDEQTISFTKGCYIGQETVARIDALGHVNKHLVKLAMNCPELPSPGTELYVDEKGVGTVTSAVVSPTQGQLALGYVHRLHCQPGTELKTDSGSAKVLD